MLISSLFCAGCFVSGLYLEGADWDMEKACLVKSKPKALIVELPILQVIPIETRRLKLKVWTTGSTGIHTALNTWVIVSMDFHCFIHYSGYFVCFVPQNTLRTPVYTTSMRRNAMGAGLVFEADLFTTKHISHWVLGGVCLCLNADWRPWGLLYFVLSNKM